MVQGGRPLPGVTLATDPWTREYGRIVRHRRVFRAGTAGGAVPVARAARALAVATLTGMLLAACGVTTTVSAPPAHSVGERQWIDNTRSLITTLDTDVSLSTVGGANLATARRVLDDESAVYTLLVAYDLFGDCGPALANAGTPSARAARTAQTLVFACGRLEDAASLFQQAMTRNNPRPLLAASRLVLTAAPLLSEASVELSALGGRTQR